MNIHLYMYLICKKVFIINEYLFFILFNIFDFVLLISKFAEF